MEEINKLKLEYENSTKAEIISQCEKLKKNHNIVINEYDEKFDKLKISHDMILKEKTKEF